MPNYKRGQVVNVDFPNDDPTSDIKIKDRPCIILDAVGNTHFKFICITGTDWRSTKRGIWIEKNTRDLFKMRLTKPSFIDLDNIKILPKDVIRNFRGVCLKMDEIDKILSENK